jgi:NCS1 family nucleobase:cation symporter-1
MSRGPDLVELVEPIPPSDLINDDLAPTPASARTWGRWHLASLWVGMSVCIPTYMLAASLIGAGLNWWQSLLAVFLGNVIVLVPMLVNGHAGTRYGIPFPVYARAAFGVRGAHLPAVLRALVACGWFGIQTWLGGLAIAELLGLAWPAYRTLGGDWSFMGQGMPAFLGFGLFWVVNLYFVFAGTESIRWLESISAPFLLLVGLGLLWWAMDRVGGLGAILTQSDVLRAAAPAHSGGFLLGLFIPWVTAMVGFWATLALNIPDFTRYTRSQRDQMTGQTVGLLTTMPLFAFIGLAVTGATVILFGRAIWNPVELIGLLAVEQQSPVLAAAALIVILVATLTTNIAANVVAPANAFSNLSPRRIGFRLGGFLAAVFGVVILPWKLLDSYQTWLLSYSGLLGAVGGVLVADYVFVRHGRLALRDLYLRDGVYAYRGGVNPAAVVAVAAGVAVALGGLLHPSLAFLFRGAWFSAGLVAAAVHCVLMRPSSERAIAFEET